jgi:hypothetical protein
VGDPCLSILLTLCTCCIFGSHWLVLDHLVNQIASKVQDTGAGSYLIEFIFHFVGSTRQALRAFIFHKVCAKED